MLLTGIGVFTPIGGQSIICVDARPIEDPLRPLDVKTKLDSEYGDAEKSTITVFSKVCSNYFNDCSSLYKYVNNESC